MSETLSLRNIGVSSYKLGSRTRRMRLGRGDGSGKGGTSGKGHKGQKARSGGFHKRGFEGGQLPLSRRLPKRGFTNFTRQEYSVVNLKDLVELKANTVVDAQYLKANGYIKRGAKRIKVLGSGDLKSGLTIKADAFSATALDKIKKAGGKVEVTHG